MPVWDSVSAPSLPDRKVTALYGDGGVGKTTLALQLAVAKARGLPFLGIPLSAGPVYALLAEDEEDDTHVTVSSVCEHYGVSLTDLKGSMRVAPRAYSDNLLMGFEGGRGQHTSFFTDLLADIQRHGPFELIILDPSADLFGGNENNRVEVRHFVSGVCGRLVLETGAAVVLSAHPSVAGMKTGEGYAGSTDWNAAVRSRLYLRRDLDESSQEADPSVRILELKKANFAQRGQRIGLRWRDGVFETEDPSKKLEASMLTEREIVAHVTKAWDLGHPLSAHHQAGTRWIVPWIMTTFKKSRKSASSILNDLLIRNILVETDFNRHRHQRALCTPKQAALTIARETTAKKRNKEA